MMRTRGSIVTRGRRKLQLNRLAQEGLPKALSPQELDPVSGRITWPLLLTDGTFGSQRTVMDEAFAWRSHYGAFNLPQMNKVQATTADMLSQLKGMISRVDSMEYESAKNFVKSLAYAARQPAA